ncbi:MAG: hypothetical protein WBQ37_06705 [Candidatus Competibacter sp.]
MGDYSSERYNPTFPHCGQLRLFFEGSYLRMSGVAEGRRYRRRDAFRAAALGDFPQNPPMTGKMDCGEISRFGD